MSIDSLKNAFEDKLTIATCKEASSNTSEGSTTGGNTTGGITTGGSNTGGGGGGGRPQEKTAEEKVNDQIKKGKSKDVIVEIDDEKTPEASFSKETLGKIVEHGQPLIINNGVMELKLMPKDVQKLGGEEASLNIVAKTLSEEDAEKLYKKPVFENADILKPVVKEIFDISAKTSENQENEKLGSLVAITVDLSGKKLTKEEIAKLSGVRYETDEKGELVLVKCGGKYNEETGKFTFFTDKFGQCGVIKDENLKKLTLFINDTYTIKNDLNDQLDAPPEIVNNRTVVPLRYIAESLGVDVKWDGPTQTITMTKDGKTITLTIGETTDGNDTPAMIKNSRTMVPVRYISEQFGANVMWFEETQKLRLFNN